MQLGSLGRKLSGSSQNMMSFVCIRVTPVMEQGWGWEWSDISFEVQSQLNEKVLKMNLENSTAHR